MTRLGFTGLLVALSIASASSLATKIRVCQNKDCCRNFGSKTSSYFYTLPQILQDLSASINVESTGCLSKCDKGPNMQVANSFVILHRVKDHIQAAAALEELGFHIPVQNMAAIAVLEKAHQAKKNVKGAASLSLIRKETGDALDLLHLFSHCIALASCSAEKDAAFTSVIRTLEPQGDSSVLARALVMRAEHYHESGRYQETIMDSRKALSMPVSIQVSRKARRLLADAHTASGQFEEALQCLQEWMNTDPSFKTKIATEIERLRKALKA